MAEIENLKIGANGTIHIVGNENIITEEWEASKTYVKDKSYDLQVNYQKFYDLCTDEEKKKLDEMIKERGQ